MRQMIALLAGLTLVALGAAYLGRPVPGSSDNDALRLGQDASGASGPLGAYDRNAERIIVRILPPFDEVHRVDDAMSVVDCRLTEKRGIGSGMHLLTEECDNGVSRRYHAPQRLDGDQDGWLFLLAEGNSKP
jgi:hypothetical protein